MELTRQQRKTLRRGNAQWPAHMIPVDKSEWPAWAKEGGSRIAVYRSFKFLAQVFSENDGIIRISVNRAEFVADGWGENISWDELQQVKREVGYGDRFAVEVYPADKDIVNVANMRHLWVLQCPLSFGWTK